MNIFFIFLFFIVFLWLITLQNKISAMSDAIKTLTRRQMTTPEPFAEKPKEETTLEQNVIDETPYEQSFSQYVVSHEEEIPAQPPVPEEVLSEPIPVQYEKNNEEVHNFIDNMQKTPTLPKDFELQKVFLENVNKIGALAIIIAMIIFIGLVTPFIKLTPLMKILLGYIACFTFIGSGFYLHRKENMKNYAEVLLGTGFAGLFITTFCAYGLYKLISTTGVISLGVLLLLATYFIADKMKTLSMLIIGLVGAYLTPVFAGAGMIANLYYILFINIISPVYTLRNKNVNWINIVNIVIAMLVFAGYSFLSGKAFLTKYAYFKIVFPIVLWGANIVYDVLRDKFNEVDNAFSMLNYVVLTLFSLILFSEAKVPLAILLGAAAIGYLLLSLYARSREFMHYKFYDYSVLINLWLIILFTGNSFQNTILWSIVGLLTALLIKKYNLKHLLFGMCAYYLSAIHGIFFAHAGEQINLLGNYIPLINQRTILYGIPVLSIIGSASLIKDIDKKLQNVFLFTATTLVYVFLIEEINSVFATFFKSSQLIEFNRVMTFIIIGLLYALNTTKFAKIYNSALFDFAGKIIYGFSVFALICASFGYTVEVMPILNFRFLAFALAVGVSILMAKMSDEKNYKDALIFAGTTLAYIGLIPEVNSVFATFFKNSQLIEFNRIMTYIIIGLLYSVNMSEFAKSFKADIFDVTSKIAYALSVLALICYSYTYPADIMPILNFRCLTYILAILAGIRLAKDDISEIFKYCAVALGFMLCHSESVGIVEISSAFQFLISLTWVLYSGTITILGILKNKKYLINSGIFFIIITILRIFLYDLANVEAIFKLIAFLALGIILLLVSFIYTKNKNNTEK